MPHAAVRRPVRSQPSKGRSRARQVVVLLLLCGPSAVLLLDAPAVAIAAPSPSPPTPPPTTPSTAVAAGDSWQLPSDGPLAALFVAPAARWGAGHRGVDIEAGAGAVVTAPHGGVVAFVGIVVDRAVVTIQHAGGLRTSLEPVVPSVAVGDDVEPGGRIGVVATDGAHCPGCLHWGVRRGATYLDPLSLLGRAPVVLLPTGFSPGRPPGGTCAAGAWPPCASGRSWTR